MNKLIKSYIANGSFLTKKCVRVCVVHAPVYVCTHAHMHMCGDTGQHQAPLWLHSY